MVRGPARGTRGRRDSRRSGSSVPSLTSDEMVKSRHRAASLRPWRGAASLQEVADLLAEGERLRGKDGPHGEVFDGRFSNEVGFWTRIPGTAWYRDPPRGQAPDLPNGRERAWKLCELQFLIRHEAKEWGLTV